MADLAAFFRRIVPNLPPVGYGERLRASIGAIIGIALTGFITQLALGSSVAVPLLIAPMGATSVLLFAVPASPLAQPWSVIGGNLISAAVGVTAAMFITDLTLAAAVAGGGAILLMLTCRCVHPPSGAVALTAVLGGAAVHEAGFSFVLWPVGVNTILIVLAAFAYNNLTGRSYPHRVEAPATPPTARPATSDRPPSLRVGFSKADVETALDEYRDFLPVDPGDVAAVLYDAEFRALRRRMGNLRCEDIMSRDVRSVAPDDSAERAIAVMRDTRITALPVADKSGRVVGILTQTDLVRKGLSNGGILRRSARLKPAVRVEHLMSVPVRSARPDMAVVDLLPLMADGGLHHLPVVDDDERLVGVITQSDVIGALMRERMSGERVRAAEPVADSG